MRSFPAFEQSLLGTAFKLWSDAQGRPRREFPDPQAVLDMLLALDRARRREEARGDHAEAGSRRRRGRPKKLRWPARDAGLTPRDGEPLFGGWPAFYQFFFERYHWTLEEVNACPIYLACILLGAVSPDHAHVRMTFKDTLALLRGRRKNHGPPEHDRKSPWPLIWQPPSCSWRPAVRACSAPPARWPTPSTARRRPAAVCHGSQPRRSAAACRTQ